MSGETMGGENLRSIDPQPVDPHLNTLTRTLFRSLHQQAANSPCSATRTKPAT